MTAEYGKAHDEQGVDIGARPLLYDLNTSGFTTVASNLASSGNPRLWLPYITFRGDGPEGALEALGDRAPAGYFSQNYDRDGQTRVGLAHESCRDSMNVLSSTHEPTPEERAEVDAALFGALRLML